MGLFFIKNDTRWNPFLWLCILFGHTSPFALLLPFAPFSFALLAFVLNCVIRCHSACRGNPFVFVVICGFHNLWKLIIGHCCAYICTPQKQQQVVHTTCRCSTLFGGYLCTKFVCSTLNIHHSGTYTRIEWLHIRHGYCCCCYPHILSFFLSILVSVVIPPELMNEISWNLCLVFLRFHSWMKFFILLCTLFATWVAYRKWWLPELRQASKGCKVNFLVSKWKLQRDLFNFDIIASIIV